jgi:hypothetical protein
MTCGRGRWLGALAAAFTALAGCTTIDAAAVAATHRLQNAPYYVDLRSPLPAPGSCARVLPVSLDRELAQQFGYGGRAQEFEPIVRALNEARQRRAASDCLAS